MELQTKHKFIVMTLLAMAIGELLPEPTDALALWGLNWITVNKESLGMLQYTLYNIFFYYCLSAIWYMFLLVVFLAMKIEPVNEMFYFIGFLAFGSVISVFISMFINHPTIWDVLLQLVIIAVISVVLIVAIDRYSKYRRKKRSVKNA